MKMKTHLFSPLAFIAILFLAGCGNSDTQKPKVDASGERNRLNNFVDWATYRGDQEGTGYSSLDQITTENVQLLEEAWTYDFDNIVRPGTSSNPIIINGVMYFSDAELNLIALNAATGEELWIFDPSKNHRRGKSLSNGIMRGEVYWEDQDGNNARIFHTTKDLIWAVNPNDGSLIESFGEGGHIDLKENHVWPAYLLENKTRQSPPPVVFKDHLIVDSNPSEGREEPPGESLRFAMLKG